MEVVYFTEVTLTLAKDMTFLQNTLFGTRTEAKQFKKWCNGKEGFFGLIMYDDGKPIAMKIGHHARACENNCGVRRKPHTFYSAVGGVLPNYRRKGYARFLMEIQHEWLIANGYKHVRTVTEAASTSMISLNLESGFIFKGLAGNPKRWKDAIVVEKKL